MFEKVACASTVGITPSKIVPGCSENSGGWLTELSRPLCTSTALPHARDRCCSPQLRYPWRQVLALMITQDWTWWLAFAAPETKHRGVPLSLGSPHKPLSRSWRSTVFSFSRRLVLGASGGSGSQYPNRPLRRHRCSLHRWPRLQAARSNGAGVSPHHL